MTVIFEPSLPSIVKSIRQRDLLNCWLRLVRKSDILPRHADFHPSRVDDELVDMMVFDVIRSGAEPRFHIIHEGLNLTHAYDNDPADRRPDPQRFLDAAIGPRRYANVIASYSACLSHRRPIYSVAMVRDQDGKDVAYERLLLPFGEAGAVTRIVGSYKTISIEGGFKIKAIMSLDADTPVSLVRAVIETAPQLRSAPINAPADEVVEI